ncbi:MAG: D-alanyl-D-alanine carboxypeptidase/D-alanyl-D-alanine-endopeptidase (penicillin-binding protein 4) [Gammaproteobacteria bacterium]
MILAVASDAKFRPRYAARLVHSLVALKWRAVFPACLLLTLLSLGAAHAQALKPRLGSLPDSVVAVLKAQRLPAQSLSVVVQRVDQSEPMVSYNAQVARNPASVMKVVTTWAGLNLLGPAFSWKTRVLVDSKSMWDVKGNLEGNLYIQGGGDPFLVTERLRGIFAAVRRRGIRRIGGDIVLDDGYFSLPRHNAAAFDGKPQRAYNVGPDAMLLNFRTSELEVTTRPGDDKVWVHVIPALHGLKLNNTVRLAQAKCRGRAKLTLDIINPSRPELNIGGSFPSGCERLTLLRVIASRDAYARGLLRNIWQSVGGTLAGTVRYGKRPKTPVVVEIHESESLSRMVWSMNKFSNNVMTRQLLLTIGAEVGLVPGTLDKGRAAISRWMSERGIPVQGFVIDNGAGLSRRARLRATTLVHVLLDAYRSPLRSELMSTLPLAAVDGSMRKRQRGGPLAGRAHLKTGLLNGVRSIAGVVHGPSGRDYILVMLQNFKGVHIGGGTRVQDAMLQWVADVDAPPETLGVKR